MMYEVLKRRFEKKENLPDLVMVDGGKGQLGVALAVVRDLRIEGVDVIGLAKQREETRREPSRSFQDHPHDPEEPQWDTDGIRHVYKLRREGSERDDARAPADRGRRIDRPGSGEDRVYLPGRKEPVYLSRWPAALFLLQRIRDEAHRFAVTYHRKIREKDELRSLLDGIPGIGAKRRKALLVFFGDVERIQAASTSELQQVEGIGRETADRIRAFLNGEPA